MNETLHTKWGSARINSSGYYWITSKKEGNHGKLLHRLIWEDFYDCEIPKSYIIHHRNHIKTDNCILNLQLIRRSNHNKLHKTGENSSQWKNYARIIKRCVDNGKQVYGIIYKGKQLRQSIYLHKLYKWWGENHPEEFLYLEI